MLTSEQIRAARAILNWTAAELARRVGVDRRTIQRAESGGGVPINMRIDTMLKIRAVLERAGIEIIPESAGSGPGVRLRRASDGE